MKLDFDKVKELLLDIEENIPLNHYKLYKSEDSPEDVYTLKKLHEAKFINAEISNTLSGTSHAYVHELTWLGHEFLDNIRSPKVAEHTKSVLKSMGSFSINVINQVASAYIKSQLGL